jgi:endo-1,4-beta-xylanase
LLAGSVALVCAAPAAAREVPVRQASALGRLVPRKAERFSIPVRPYREVDVRLRAYRCRRPPAVRATTGGRSVTLTVPRRFAWRRISGAGGPAGRLAVTLRLLTRQAGCRVLVDRLRAQERIALGAAMYSAYMGKDERYERRAAESFTSVTPENDMKMVFVQPRQGEFDFAAADRVVDWALAHGKTVHGHTLVYGDQLPSWLTERDLLGRSLFSRAELLQILETHIKTVVGRYRGRVASWDVVNEAFLADGSYRRNLFLEKIGPQYVELAFKWAREADPDARLFYNDAGAELINPMSDTLLAQVAEMRAGGVPIDGVGFQAHLDVGHPPGFEALRANLARFSALGLDVAYSELDVSVDVRHPPADPVSAQSGVFANVAAACAAEPRCTRLTVWGVGDAVSWRGPERAALPFDLNYVPKPAWTALTAALG